LYRNAEVSDSYHRTFKLYGVLFHDLLSGFYEEEGTKPGALEGKGVSFLQIDQTRKKMTGYCSWFDRDS
jgi:hypothetical protein